MQTLMVNPADYAGVIEALGAQHNVEIMANPYVPRGQAFLFPTRNLTLGGSMTRVYLTPDGRYQEVE